MSTGTIVEGNFRPSFPEQVDNSMRTSFVNCPRKFQFEYLEHFTPPKTSIHLHAGACFARGLEVTRKTFYVEGQGAKESLLAGGLAIVEEWGDYEPFEPDHNKRLERVVQALGAYFTEYPMASDHVQPWKDQAGIPMIEYSFAHPLDIEHPDTGQPILYTGRFDMLGEYNAGCYCDDEKTTGQLGASWLKNWHLRSQFTGYTWAARVDGFPCNGAIVRGISLLKRSFGHAEVIELRADWQIEQWYDQLIRDISRMKRCWEEGFFDQNLDQACAAYGGCGFQRLCSVKNWEQWASQDFIRQKWNPVTGERELIQ